MASSSVSTLQDHLGYWMRYVSNQVSHAFAVKVERKGVTVAEWAMMREMLRLGPVPPSAIADSMGITRGAISKLVDRLSRKKLVNRSSGGGDQRYQSVALTPAGRRLVPVLAALADANDAEFFGHLSDRDRHLLQSVLKDLVQLHGWNTVPVQ